MVLNMKENGWIRIDMVMEFTSGQTIVDMKGIGRTIRHMGKGSSTIQMETSSKGSGIMIWPMGLDSIFMSMEQSMRVIGRMTISMVLEKRYGLMEVYSKVNMSMVRRMV